MLSLVTAVLVMQVQVRDHARDWRRLESDHFDIHYGTDAMLPRARQFAGWFEDARRDLREKTGVEPRRIQVFLYRPRSVEGGVGLYGGSRHCRVSVAVQ